MVSAQEKEMGGDYGFTNKMQGHQTEHEPDVKQSLDSQDVSDTQFSSISAPSDRLPNGPPSQELVAPEAQKLKSKGMIALIMSALCVRRLQQKLNILLQMLI